MTLSCHLSFYANAWKTSFFILRYNSTVSIYLLKKIYFYFQIIINDKSDGKERYEKLKEV